jgi:DNA-binding MarR family transcriptional regulator
VADPAGAAAPRGSDLPLLLLRGFRALIDDARADLAAAEPDLGPLPGMVLDGVVLDGMVLDAIGDGITAAELGRRLGVSRQAAAKTVAALEDNGYVERVPDPADARAKIVRITPRGRRACWRTAETLARHRRMWVERLGAESVDWLEEALRTMTAEAFSPLSPPAATPPPQPAHRHRRRSSPRS